MEQQDEMDGFDKPDPDRNALQEEIHTRKLYGWFWRHNHISVVVTLHEPCKSLKSHQFYEDKSDQKLRGSHKQQCMVSLFSICVDTVVAST